MAYPILAKLSEHLNTIKELKENIPFLLLSSLLYTEECLLCNSYKNEKERIERYIEFINAGTDHDGDCVKHSSSCILCHALDSITRTKETIEESKFVLKEMSEEERILRLIEVLLATQPEKRFNSEEERRELTLNLSKEEWDKKYTEYYIYEDDIVKRIEKWEGKTEEEKGRIRQMGQEMLKYTRESELR